MVKLIKSRVKAREIGAAQGKSAASWLIDGNTTDATLRMFREGIDDGDPAVLDMLPTPDLSGQWADAYAVRDLMEETEAYPDEESDVCDAYEESFADAVETEIQRMISVRL